MKFIICRLLYQENEEKKLKALNVMEQDVVVKPKDRFYLHGNSSREGTRDA